MIPEATTQSETPETDWTRAVRYVSNRAHETLPDTLHGRLEMATALVLAGKVSQEDRNHWSVEGSHGARYATNTTCTCEDYTYERAPAYREMRWCKHLLAVALQRRALEVTMAELEWDPDLDAASDAWPVEEELEPPQPAQGALPVPSAPAPLRSIRAIVADLSQPLPPACVATKTVKGTTLRYLHWTTVARVLDAYAPGWSGTIVRIDQIASACVITYRITIPCLEGTVWREATGQEEAQLGERAYGDSTSNGEAMAFKRAAAKFGLGAWLYAKDGTDDALTAHLARRARG